jgi:TetR/AcrR family transcriptional repressor of lmrAB and yxaGH operons
MAKADDSKGKTLTAAVKLFRQQGYHGTALHDILAAGGAPRGSLYFHFPKGKEEIGAGALSLAGEAVRQAIVQAAEKSDSAESFLVRIVRAMAPRNPRCWALRPEPHSRNGNWRSNAGCSASA